MEEHKPDFPAYWGWGIAVIAGISILVFGWWWGWTVREKNELLDQLARIEIEAISTPFLAMSKAEEARSQAIAIQDDYLLARSYYLLAETGRDINRFGQHYSASSRYLAEQSLSLFSQAGDSLWWAKSKILLHNLEAIELRDNELWYDDPRYVELRAGFGEVHQTIENHQSKEWADVYALLRIAEASLQSIPSRNLLSADLQIQQLDSLRSGIKGLQECMDQAPDLSPLVKAKLLKVEGELWGMAALLTTDSIEQRDMSYERSRQKLETGVRIFMQIGDSLGAAGTMHGLGEIMTNWYGDTGANSYLVKADSLLRTQLTVFRKFVEVGESELDLARLFHYQAAFEPGTPGVLDSARQYYRKSYFSAVKSGDPGLATATLRNWRWTYEVAEEKRELDSLAQRVLPDVSKRVAIIESLSSLNVLQDQIRQEQELAKTNQRNLFIISACIVLVLLLVVYMVIQQIKIDHYRRYLEKRIRLFQLKKYPHMIRNSFHALDGLINAPDPEYGLISRYLVQLSRLADSVMESSDLELISLEKEIESLRLYGSIMMLRFGKFSFQIEDHQIDYKEKILIPPMLIQPFMENSILHGMQPKFQESEYTGELTISFAFESDNSRFLECRILDNGIGRKRSKELQKEIGNPGEEGGRQRATQISLERLIMYGTPSDKAIHIIDHKDGQR